MSSTTHKKLATLDDLRHTEGKAELIAGRIVVLMPTGHRPNQIAGEIFVSLKNWTRAAGRGVAYTDNMGFAVPELPSGRQSFAPDAAYYDGPLPSDDMDFVNGPPTLAVEVRSKSDYGDAAETALAAKRADYFEAGTLVVWDVDPGPSASVPIALWHPDCQRSSTKARPPMPSRRFRAGGWT